MPVSEKLKRRIIECPRCHEGDERSHGLNRCGLCGYAFYLATSDFLTPAGRAKLEGDRQ